MTDGRLRRALFPDPPRRLSHSRAANIALRTAHVAVTGILLGGHAFGVTPDVLRPILWLVIATGGGLATLESLKTLNWVHQGWGVALLIKLSLLCAMPFFWSVRVSILLAVVVIASVESHMPARLRHYSFLYRRVMKG